MRRFFLLLLLSLCAFACKAGEAPPKPIVEYQYVGSVNSNKFHYPECKAAQRIKPENLIKFIDYADAEKQEYIPCKLCKPKK